MKKILLSFGAIGCALLANAQILLNEVYVRPNPNALPRHRIFIIRMEPPLLISAGMRVTLIVMCTLMMY
jgi:hypothetical protein